jgi:alpha-methylacyl-CoA racemase
MNDPGRQSSPNEGTQQRPAGPLAGVKVLEFAALGPVPFCAMLLADMGADVVHIARAGPRSDPGVDVTLRGRRIVTLALKEDSDNRIARELAARSDILLEGNRPGVMERLGLGPEMCHARNPRLIYGRMTGWGQDGPLAPTAGHDINFIALSGALHAIGTAGSGPVPPLNLVGDYGGGALFLAFGVVCALLEAHASGRGQVIDAAMLDGAAMLMSQCCGQFAKGTWSDKRGGNLLDGGAPWYATYETADGKYVAVGAIEEKFWRALLVRLGIEPDMLPPRESRAEWGIIRDTLARTFRRRTRDEWTEVFRGTDACLSPVLELGETRSHEHIAARGCFAEIQGVMQPTPAPRFSRTPGRIRGTTAGPDTTAEVLRDWGIGHPPS